MSTQKQRLAERINIGPSDLLYTPVGSQIPIYLGLTKGGTQLEYVPDFFDLKSDQTGTTVLDSVLIGEAVTVTTELLDTTLKHITTVVPTADIEYDGQDVKAATFGRRPGLRLGTNAGLLRVHPIAAGVGKTDMDVIVYRAANKAGLNLSYELENEWVIPCEFVGVYDDFRPEGDQLFRIGEMTDYAEPNKRIVAFWITPANATTTVGKAVTFNANAMYEDGTTEDVTQKAKWISSDEDIATVAVTDGKATATPKTAGTVVIQAQLIGYTSTTTLKVGE